VWDGFAGAWDASPCCCRLLRDQDKLGGVGLTWWDDLGDARLDEATRAALLAGLKEESAGRSVDELAAERDAAIIRILASRRVS